MFCSMTSSAQTQGLTALESRIRQDLDYLGLPAKNWTIPASHPEGEVKDVVIVGGGMSGLAVAAALAFNGVDAEIYDQSPAGLEGPLGHHRPHDYLALPQGVARPLPRHSQPHLPRLVRGATAWKAGSNWTRFTA
jgi:NADPH-dependent 2,4-dienoyl-CoA reductase/sulfur reductase-like enzyme